MLLYFLYALKCMLMFYFNKLVTYSEVCIIWGVRVVLGALQQVLAKIIKGFLFNFSPFILK